MLHGKSHKRIGISFGKRRSMYKPSVYISGKRIKAIHEAIGYAIEDGRLDVGDYEKMTLLEADKYEKEQEHDPY